MWDTSRVLALMAGYVKKRAGDCHPENFATLPNLIRSEWMRTGVMPLAEGYNDARLSMDKKWADEFIEIGIAAWPDYHVPVRREGMELPPVRLDKSAQ